MIAVNPQKHPEANYMAAMQYIAWVTSAQGQKIIREYTMGGQAAVHPGRHQVGRAGTGGTVKGAFAQAISLLVIGRQRGLVHHLDLPAVLPVLGRHRLRARAFPSGC